MYKVKICVAVVITEESYTATLLFYETVQQKKNSKNKRGVTRCRFRQELKNI